MSSDELSDDPFIRYYKVLMASNYRGAGHEDGSFI